MFSAMYRYRATKTRKYVKELFLSFLKLKTELKKSFDIYCHFCLARSLKNDLFFFFHIALSQPILKVMS